MSKKKIFLTIDFEDWKYDTSLYYGFSNENNINKKILYKTFYNIENFLKKNLANDKITFFCTGVLARKFPEIIQEIDRSGHEIACHYYNHKVVTQDTIINFEYNLQKSKDVFENITNKTLKGFRAPKFSIYHSHREYIEIISKYFEYDSSLNLQSISDLKNLSCDGININFFPVYTTNFFFNLIKYKPGGTYMKMFPYKLLYRNIMQTFNKNENTILYLHPYEFLYNRELVFKFNDLKNKNLFFILYWLLRQHQWISGNGLILQKLQKIFNEFESGGKIEELL